MQRTPVIEPARPEELDLAFGLAFQHLDAAERQARVQAAVDLVKRKDLDQAGVLVARLEGQILASLICATTAGAGSLIWPPQVRPEVEEAAAIADRLVQHGCAWLRGRGAKLCQAMLPSVEAHLAAALQRNGFAHVTCLCYLRLDLKGQPPASPQVLTYQPYPAQPQLFHETLLRTYEGTQDCPELTGARDIDDIIAGHRSQGSHDPQTWWLARHQGQPVGVLLIAPMPEWSSWEVAYVGVTATARRRGFGRQLMHKAIAEAQRAGINQLTLSVDQRNQSAWNLYQSLNFQTFDQREVYLVIWGAGNS